MTQQPGATPQFYLTAPTPCPYLDGQYERKVFTHLVGERAGELNDILTQGGFRRSQNIAYRPACESCRACVSVRILVGEFEPSRNMRRIVARNADLVVSSSEPAPTAEQFSLFRTYLDDRHRRGGMSDMTALDFAMMMEDTHVSTRVVEYRLRNAITDGPGELVGVALVDRMGDGWSMVYSFYDSARAERSLGTYIILDHINRARKEGLPHVYLGYWVAGSRKMAYKVRFAPQEHLGPKGWARFPAPGEP
jgi:arginine-tRNA-protein transferase